MSLNQGENKPVTQEGLQNAWDLYASTLVDKKKMILHALFKSVKPAIKDNTIIITVGGKHQHDLLEEDKSEFLPFMKANLQNYNLVMQVNVVKDDSGFRNPYTSEEKFKFMAEKNPMLIELRKILGLDMD